MRFDAEHFLTYGFKNPHSRNAVPKMTFQEENASSELHRRASIRYRCDRHPTRRVFLSESYQSLSAEIHDLSLGGVGLICDRCLPNGTILFIDLMMMDVPMESLARVVHSHPCEDSRWLLGCEFDRPLTAQELSLALAR